METFQEIELAEFIAKVVRQQIEGLLYDLDLLPEQIKTQINDRRRLVVEELHKQNQALRAEMESLPHLPEITK